MYDEDEYETDVEKQLHDILRIKKLIQKKEERIRWLEDDPWLAHQPRNKREIERLKEQCRELRIMLHRRRG